MPRKSYATFFYFLLVFMFLSSCGQSGSSNGEIFTLNNPVISIAETPSTLDLWDFSTEEDCIVRIRWMDESTNEARFIVEKSVYTTFSQLPEISTVVYDCTRFESENTGLRYFFDTLPSAAVFAEYRVRSENSAGFSSWTPYEGIVLNSCIP